MVQRDLNRAVINPGMYVAVEVANQFHFLKRGHGSMKISGFHDCPKVNKDDLKLQALHDPRNVSSNPQQFPHNLTINTTSFLWTRWSIFHQKFVHLFLWKNLEWMNLIASCRYATYCCYKSELMKGVNTTLVNIIYICRIIFKFFIWSLWVCIKHIFFRFVGANYTIIPVAAGDLYYRSGCIFLQLWKKS